MTPEHAPPINPSPWYAFRYEAEGSAPVNVTLRYLGGRHRYAPKYHDGSAWRDLPVELAEKDGAATLSLPPGKGLDRRAGDHHDLMMPMADLLRWSAASGAPVVTLGHSHDGRVCGSNPAGPGGRPASGRAAGPPASARSHRGDRDAGLCRLSWRAMMTRVPQFAADLQFLVVPMLNPDGVVRGHWRANRGAVDLNRDWGPFTQPETRSVKAWLDALPQGIRPVLMGGFPFDSQQPVLRAGRRRPARRSGAFGRHGWMAARRPLPAILSPSSRATPIRAAARPRNWFHATYAIPAYTYEVADDADR